MLLLFDDELVEGVGEEDDAEVVETVEEDEN